MAILVSALAMRPSEAKLPSWLRVEEAPNLFFVRLGLCHALVLERAVGHVGFNWKADLKSQQGELDLVEHHEFFNWVRQLALCACGWAICCGSVAPLLCPNPECHRW